MKQRGDERGQAMVETALTILLFVALALGVMTFAHAWMVANMITHAACDGARLAATWPTRDGTCGRLDSTVTGPIETTVKNEIATVAAIDNLEVHITQNPQPPTAPLAGGCPVSSTPTVTVTVSAPCVPWLFPILPVNYGTCTNGETGFAVNRQVVFHDEGVS
jgi:Flp pilus assembly protein TadG